MHQAGAEKPVSEPSLVGRTATAASGGSERRVRARFDRATRRRLWFGLCTVLGLEPKGFFIPYRYASDVPAPGERPGYDAVEALFAGHRGDFAALLEALDPLADDLLRIGDRPAPDPRWQQDWFPRLDGAIAYALVRRHRPERIVEVGSGHSTRFLARAVRDGGLRTRITAIDPAPRATLADLDITLIRATLQTCDERIFTSLRAGDFLVIDSSHILMPGSDVDRLLCHLLPCLPSGVLVHIHDVFLPDDYPPEWSWRGYNEQLGVAALLGGGGWKPIFSSHYVVTRMAANLAASAPGRLPISASAKESSLWLEKRSSHGEITPI